MRLSKKKMLAALDDRYIHIYYDEKKNLVNLYDKSKPARLCNGGDYVATVEIDNVHGKYIYLSEGYKSVEDLSDAIDKHIETLPYYHGYYDPYYKKSYVITKIMDDYLKELGFVFDWNLRGDDEGKYVLKNRYKETVFALSYHVDDDTIGRIYRYIGEHSFITSEFNGIEEAIGSINSMMVDLLLETSNYISILSKLTNSRNNNLKKTTLEGFNIVVEEQKDTLIEKLENELKKLKEN